MKMTMTGVGFEQAKKPIAYQDIEEAAEALKSQQKNVTGDNIREHLGRGSKGTITKYLRQWKSENGVKTVDEASIPNHILHMVRDLLKRVHEDSDVELNEHKQEIDLQLIQKEILIKKMEQENATLALNRDQFSVDLKKEQTDRQQLQSEFSNVQNEKSALTARVSLLESHNTGHKNEINRLHQLNKESNDRVTQQQAELSIEHKHHAAVLEKLRSEYEAKITQLQSQLSNSLLEKTELQTKHDHLIVGHNKLSHDFETLKNTHLLLQKNCDHISSENAQFRNTVDELKIQRDQLSQKLESKTNEQTEIYIQLKTFENSNESMKIALEKLEHKMQMQQEQSEKTAQEKAFLEGQLKQLQSRKILDSHAV